MCLHIRVLSRELTYPTWEMESHFQKCLKKKDVCYFSSQEGMYNMFVSKYSTCVCVCVFSIICTKINCFHILNIIPHSFRKNKGLTSNSKKVPGSKIECL